MDKFKGTFDDAAYLRGVVAPTLSELDSSGKLKPAEDLLAGTL